MTFRTTFIATLTIASLAALGCDTDTDTGTELPEDVDLALEAAIDSLDDMRADLPISDAELSGMMRETAVEALAEIECPRHGVLAGLWGSAALGSPIEGFFFELQGDERGLLHGEWAPLDCGDCPDGGYFGDWESLSGREGEMEGYYDDNRFVGEWFEVDPEADDPDLPHGEMVGRYHRINELGGYFIGVWSVCDDNGNGNGDNPDGYDDPDVETDDDEDGHGDDNGNGHGDDNGNGNADDNANGAI